MGLLNRGRLSSTIWWAIDTIIGSRHIDADSVITEYAVLAEWITHQAWDGFLENWP